MTTATQQKDAVTETTNPLLESVPTDTVTEDQVRDAIIGETGCKAGAAYSMIHWVNGLVNKARGSNYRTQYPTDRQMRGRDYQLFEAIMPHGTAAVPGSAHDLLERYLLDPSKDETGLWHDTEHDEPGSRHYCTVQVALGVVR